jgi:hypothetical protein
MKQDVSFFMFCDSFSDTYKNNFSYEGKRALYDYVLQYEEDSGVETECDPIALCCEYTEYDSAYEAMQNYQPDDMPVESEEGDDLLEVEANNEKEARRWLEEKTQVIDIEGGGVIIADF